MEFLLSRVMEKIRRMGWQKLPTAVRKRLSYGTSRYCPLCHSAVRAFKPQGPMHQADAACPVCDSHGRHRLTYLFFSQYPEFLQGSPLRLLHVAPEKQLKKYFQQHPQIDYLSSDLAAGRAMATMDVTDIHYPEGSFGAIYCSHVLEHVSDDRRAMREFHRVLTPGGWAMILVPISGDKTLEDPAITTPQDRLRTYWQEDHVRLYGTDIQDRLREAGFQVDCYTGSDLATAEQIVLYAIRGESVFVCRKPVGKS